MPLYEFHCLNCDTQFEELVFSQTELPPCPNCSSLKTEKLISRPCRSKHADGSNIDIPSMSSQAGSGSSACAGCSGGSCATCGH